MVLEGAWKIRQKDMKPDEMNLLVAEGEGLTVEFNGIMQDIMRAAKLDPPKFEMTTFFRAIFYRNPEYSLKSLPGKGVEKVVEKLSANQQKIIEAIEKNPVISAKSLANLVGISSRKIQDNLAKLKNMGILKRVGPDKGGHWEILK